MKTSELKKFNLGNGSVPMYETLCFFGVDENFTLIDGWLCCEESGHYIQERNSWKRHDPKEFTNYHEILNDKGGFIFCGTPKPVISEPSDLLEKFNSFVDLMQENQSSFTPIVWEREFKKQHEELLGVIKSFSFQAKSKVEEPVPNVEKKEEWISVEERFPEQEQWCLCYFKKERVLGQFFKGAEDDQNIYSNIFLINGKVTTRVTHWQPLPPPPKQEDAGNELNIK